MSGYLVDIFSNKNEDEATKKAFKYYTAFDYVNSILSVVSGIYLGFSIYQIRKLNKEKETELNYSDGFACCNFCNFHIGIVFISFS